MAVVPVPGSLGSKRTSIPATVRPSNVTLPVTSFNLPEQPVTSAAVRSASNLVARILIVFMGRVLVRQGAGADFRARPPPDLGAIEGSLRHLEDLPVVPQAHRVQNGRRVRRVGQEAYRTVRQDDVHPAGVLAGPP